MHWASLTVLNLVVTSTLVGVVLTIPITRRFALRYGFVDQPGTRKLHRRPIPLAGGITLYFAIIVTMLVFYQGREAQQLAGILAGATLIVFSGAWDDRQGLSVSAKLAAQLLATILLIATGTRVMLPLHDGLDIALTVFWVVGITNAFNLLDNMDGLSSGISAVASGFFLLLAIINGQYLVSMLGAAVLGGCLGFLFYNFNPARVFLGDAGSLLLGFLMAVLGIKLRFPDNTNLVTWMVPVVVLAVPIFDTSLVFFSRMRRGKNPLTTPGKDHVSHRLLDLGWSQKKVALFLYLAGVLAGIGAVWVSFSAPKTGYPVFFSVVAAFGGLALWLRRVKHIVE